jgi:hypothetical protein
MGDSNLVANNIKSGVSIFGVQGNVEEGVDTSDATAEASEIMNGETAYVNGNKVTGTFTIDNEITAQYSLVEQIQTALQNKASVTEPILQEKTVTPTKSQQMVTPDNGYDGLNLVTVNAIPNDYIIPNGTMNITENGTYDVTSYTSVNINVASSGGSGDNGEEIAALLSNTLTTLDNSICTSVRTRACQQCTTLVTVNLPSATSVGTYAFYNCSGLTTVHLPAATSLQSQCFYSCTKLKHADFGNLSSIAAQTFNACSALTELILRKTGSVCTLSNTSAISNTAIGKGTGYIYVPAALIDTYKTATNWSTFANQFRAIEDYPDICG